ncbi:MAG: hypothetical protein AAF483_03930 [Planctomycetota bacterium]
MRYSKYHIHIFGSLSLLILFGSVYQWSLAPLWRGLTEAKELKEELAGLKNILPGLIAENKQLKSDHTLIQAPEKTVKEPVQLPTLEIISAMLERRSISMDNLIESNTKASSTEVEMQLKGSYINLLNLIQDLDAHRTATKILSFDITPSNNEPEEYSARIQVRFIWDIQASLVSMN